MKTIKMMLFSLALLAVVGGALAFKARYTKIYCTSTYNFEATPPTICSIFVASTTVGAQDNPLVWTTLPRTVAGVATCLSTNGISSLPCIAPTKLIHD